MNTLYKIKLQLKLYESFIDEKLSYTKLHDTILNHINHRSKSVRLTTNRKIIIVMIKLMISKNVRALKFVTISTKNIRARE